MINNTGQKLIVVTEQDGEVLFKIENGESLNIRSVQQTKNDKYYSPKIKINIKGRFTKVMDKEKEIVDKLIKFPSTYIALSIMRRYIVPNYNVLMKDGKKYKCVDLAQDMNITRQMAAKHIAKLKQENILSEIETNKGKLMVLNPYYYFKGDEVPKLVLDAFDKPIKD